VGKKKKRKKRGMWPAALFVRRVWLQAIPMPKRGEKGEGGREGREKEAPSSFMFFGAEIVVPGENEGREGGGQEGKGKGKKKERKEEIRGRLTLGSYLHAWSHRTSGGEEKRKARKGKKKEKRKGGETRFCIVIFFRSNTATKPDPLATPQRGEEGMRGRSKKKRGGRKKKKRGRNRRTSVNDSRPVSCSLLSQSSSRSRAYGVENRGEKDEGKGWEKKGREKRGSPQSGRRRPISTLRFRASDNPKPSP